MTLNVECKKVALDANYLINWTLELKKKFIDLQTAFRALKSKIVSKIFDYY